MQDYEQGRKSGNANAGGMGSTSGFGGFGQQPQTGASNTSGGGLFGQSQPTGQTQQSGGLFGNSGTQSGGLFGQQPQQQQQSGGLFGQQQSQPGQTGGLFGQQQNQQQPASSGFSFGGANNTQQQQQPATGGFSFGGANNAAAPKPSGLFGGGFGSNTATNTGSTSGFSFGQQPQQQTQPQQPGQTGGAFGGGGGFSFGGASAAKPATGGLFGSAQPAAAPSQPAFGGFGAASSTTGAAAPKPAFSFGGAAPAAGTTGTGFGTNTTSGGLFGSQQPSAAGQPATGGSLFGGLNQTNQQQGSSGLGSGFGASSTNNTGGGLFGGAASKPGGLFGSSTTQPAGQSGFGTGSAGGFSFGGASNQQQQSQQAPKSGGFSFGAPASTTGTGGGLFGNTGGAGGGGLFGSSNLGNMGTSGGLFGSSTSQNNTGGGLGGSTFGAGAGQSNLGGSTGLFGSTNQQSQQNLPPQGVGLTADPYGTDALFHSMTGGTAANQPNLPFNVSTSSTGPLGSLSASHKSKPLPAPMMSPFRPNPKNASRVVRLRGGTPARDSSPSAGGSGLFGRSSSPALNGAGGLFKGLSDEVAGASDGSLPNQAFVGRQSVKRLVLTDGPNSSFGRSTRADTEDHTSGGGSLRESVLSGARGGTPRSVAALNGNRGVAFSPALETGLGGSAVKRGGDFSAALPAANESFGEASFTRSRSGLFNETPSKANMPSKTQGKDLLSRDQPAQEVEPTLEDISVGSYHISPSLNALRQMSYSALSQVRNFTVSRKGFGSVRFLVPVDLTSVNDLTVIAGGIVQLREKEIWVYPQQEDLESGLDGMKSGYERNPVAKAKQGDALNVPAEVALEKCWPLDKATRQPLKDGSHPRVKQHIAKLQKKGETRYIEYKPVEGLWRFEVEHFSRYGLDDTTDDEDGDATQTAVRSSRKGGRSGKQNEIDEEEDDAPPPRRSLKGSRRGQFSDEAPPSLTSESSEEEDYQEDDEELASQASTDMRASDLDEDALYTKAPPSWQARESTPRARRSFRGASATPRAVREGTSERDMHANSNPPWAAQLGLEPRRVQVMQASFFGSRAPGELEEQARTPREDQIKDSKTKVVVGQKGGRHVGKEWTDRKTRSKGAELGAQGLISRVVEVAPHSTKISRLNIAESIVNGRDGVPLDAGLAFGRSFRVGTGPGGMLIHNGRLQGVKATPSPGSATSFSILKLEETAIFQKEQEEEMAGKALRLLELQLAHSIIEGQGEDKDGLETDCPTIFASPDLRFKHFVAKFDNADRSHEALLWRLGGALFDELELRLPADASTEVVQKVTSIRRKAAVSNWLRQAVVNSVETECRGHVAASRKDALIFSHLTGNQVEKACCAALDSGDLRLATLLAQVGGGDDEVRADVAEQLAIWRNQGVDAHISQDHRKIYELISGNVAFTQGTSGRSVRDPLDRVEDLNIASGLDWKRAFGLHLWYATSHDAPLTSGFERYEAAVGGAGEIAPPLPPYREKASMGSLKLKEMLKSGSYDRDGLFHLIKLYANPTFDLETALSPLGFGSVGSDYRLPWHLYVLLSRVLRRRDFGDRVDLGVEAAEQAEEVGLSVEGNSARADNLTSDYAHQLEMQGQWTWAAFILLHLELPSSRMAAVKALLARNVDKLDAEAQAFLTARLKVPRTWLFEAQAIRARYEDDLFSEYELLIKAHLFSAAHSVVVRHLAPEAVIRGDLGMIFTLFSPFQDAFPDRLYDLPGWTTGGQVYVDYAACLQQLPNLIGAAETKSLSRNEESRLQRLAARVVELLDLVPALFPDVESNLNHLVARSDMLGALHNLARVLSARSLAPEASAAWDSSTVPPEIEHVQNAANDYMSLLLA